MLMFLFALSAIPIIQSVFVAIPGRPSVFNTSVPLKGEFDNYTNCAETCSGDDDCSAIYYNSANFTCITFDYGTLFSVTKIETLPVTEIFLFKTNSTTCSISPDTIYYSRNISYTDMGTYWEVEGNCPLYWLFVKRPQYDWCIRLFYNESKTRDQINAFCADTKNGSTISGIGSVNEWSFVVQQAQNYLQAQDRYIIVDGQLSDDCTTDNIQYCQFPANYTFYDKYILDTTYYNFKDSTLLSDGSLNRCIRLNATTDKTSVSQVAHFSCDTGTMLYPCGRLARYL